MFLNIRRGILIVLIATIIANVWNYYCRIDFPFANQKGLTWDKESYWYYPWGDAVVHKGIDVFGELDREIISPVSGIIVAKGYSNRGGNYIYLLAVDLKVYYFAHLSRSKVATGNLIRTGQVIGQMGDTGNAKYSPFHLHFSIYSVIPIFEYYDARAIMGWKKMFYLNPTRYFK